MAEQVTINFYSDLHCPYAYLTAYRLCQLREEYRGRITIVYKSLALEYVNQQPTPKPMLDNELPLLMLEEPSIPYQPWHRPLSEWPVTMWPAFEAVKCAERQGHDQASALDWAIRSAFFGKNRCIAMRHVLFALAEEVGLAMKQFVDDFDRGVTKHMVLQETHTGWEELQVAGSPTFVLPSGKQINYLALPKVSLDFQQHARPVALQPAPCSAEACLDLFRDMFNEALAAPAA